ncbi:MAG TPA: HlyD family efflux transporter periplasmic adaptor subunit [Candidatus Acidoferrum sp.]|nr:HlyD family efflux transporter periplasmic adaptor subunit [Candidatus Acidoferrum sp.]
MKRRLIAALAVVLVIAAGALAWGRWSPADDPAPGAPGSWLERLLTSIGLGGSSAAAAFSGYVEADYVMVTSTIGGTVIKLDVARGDQVVAGAPLFALDDAAERAARDEAAAKLAQAQSQLANLRLGRRQPEIDAIAAQRAQAEAALRQSQADYERQVQLRATRVSSQKQLDDARAQRDRDQSHLAELDAQLEVARMPAREDEIRAGEAAVTAAQAALAQAEWRLGQKSGVAPQAGLVVDTLYRPGEMVAAGQPIVQLLPPANVKIRFFVPEREVGRIAIGQTIRVSCDGCGAPIAATVRFVSPQAEFTPPVIYSREERSRLVFMVEARPNERAETLHVGQPVDVAAVQP